MTESLSPQSLFILQKFPPFIEFCTIAILPLASVIFPYWYTRKQFLKYDKSLWKNVRWPLLISLVPLLFVLRESAIVLLSMGDFSRAPHAFKAIALLFCSIGLFAFVLWINKSFELRSLIFFIKGLFIGLISCLLILGAFSALQEFLLRRDPAYLNMLQKIEARKQKRLSKE